MQPVPRFPAPRDDHQSRDRPEAQCHGRRAGRFNFPQLKPGAYSVKAEAEGFEPQQNDNVISGLGQKQTVDFTLKVAQSKQTVEVSGEAPLINPGERKHLDEL